VFLKYLDALEADKAMEAALDGKKIRRHPRPAVSLGNLGRAQGKEASSITMRHDR